MRITAAACQSQIKTLPRTDKFFNELSESIEKLSEIFSNNCTQARQEALRVPADSAELRGLPPALRCKFLASSGENLVFPLTMEAGHCLLNYCSGQAVRKEWYQAYMSSTRANKDYNNEPIAILLTRARHAWADMHGYDNYYAYSLKEKMIKNPKALEQLLAAVRRRWRRRVKKIMIN